jgi:4-hydroxythreonine-4-phosphate dehydrogenase
MKSKILVGISHGDINGISYEVIIKTLLDNRIYEACIPILYGSSKVAAYHRKALNLPNLSLNMIRSADEASHKRAYLINCIDEDIRVELGKSTSMAGESSYVALQKAVDDLKEGKIDILVTGPVDKHNMQSDRFTFPGHTEYLASQFPNEGVLMLMVNEVMRMGVVTGHIPLARVAAQITTEEIIKKLKIMNKSLIQDFNVRKPRIAVLALNPHAGDTGLLGDEEDKFIIPAIQKAREMDILAFGPFPADGFFGFTGYTKYDGILAMYHDQGLIPFKALTYEGGVNFTAGLPVIRTSPAHGTGYEIVGKNEASEASFRQAIYLACDILKNRTEYAELTANPLKTADPASLQQ